ncbi:hypothetical protein [Acuticoccus kandeliae]|uniref:hypothetical protein n=1 Tax=Acuticoccus kandeliae TaxID=2073160 RepID=UPI000D3E9DEA|nr:hypothetical protein [Acuticoccus kandeliae]
MRLIGIAAVFAAVLAAIPARAEFPFKPDQAAKKLTGAATKIGAPLRFRPLVCAQEQRQVCRFSAPAVQGMASSLPGKNAADVTMILDSDSGEGLDALVAFGALIALVSPELSPTARGEIIMSTVSRVLVDGEEMAAVTRGGVRYTPSFSSFAGLWFIASSTK